ncbi:hypothetical protein DPMN_191466 [Dreissena polymorpha]|uniref:Uncharacterized protein n=1 Tax=Dreissena polymorpha TaxID=45954 RepID=A0A9D3XYQ7_DREPO|nr:hypothetical protein DPMN_191466 [Dreissena polymorpha]
MQKRKVPASAAGQQPHPGPLPVMVRPTHSRHHAQKRALQRVSRHWTPSSPGTAVSSSARILASCFVVKAFRLWKNSSCMRPRAVGGSAMWRSAWSPNEAEPLPGPERVHCGGRVCRRAGVRRTHGGPRQLPNQGPPARNSSIRPDSV